MVRLIHGLNHFILIVFFTLYCYQKLYTIFSLFMRMGFIWWSAPPSEQIGYLIFHSFLDTQHTPISCLFRSCFYFPQKTRSHYTSMDFETSGNWYTSVGCTLDRILNLQSMETRYKETNLHISIPEMKFCQVDSYKTSRWGHVCSLGAKWRRLIHDAYHGDVHFPWCL